MPIILSYSPGLIEDPQVYKLIFKVDQAVYYWSIVFFVFFSCHSFNYSFGWNRGMEKINITGSFIG